MTTPSQSIEEQQRDQRRFWVNRFDQLHHIEGASYAALDRLLQELQSAHASQTAELQWCEECNFPLSPCGEQNVDGTPSMDCKVCQLRDKVAELERKLADMEKLSEQNFLDAVRFGGEAERAKEKLEQAREDGRELSEKLFVITICAEALRAALKECHPATIWDHARMFYSHRDPASNESIAAWHSRRCEQANKALASSPDTTLKDRVVEVLEEAAIAAHVYHDVHVGGFAACTMPNCVRARQLLTELGGTQP